MITLDGVEALLSRHLGLDQSAMTQADLQRLTDAALRVFAAGSFQHPKRDQRPDLLEQDLEAMRAEIRAIIRRIEALDGWALSVARRARATREIEAAGPDPAAILAAVDRAEQAPASDWPDKAAIRNLRELEEGLRKPIETLIRLGSGLPSGKGTKPNLVARKLALAAARAWSDLTDSEPTYWKDSTAFARLADDLFRGFGIKADTRRACEWALSELAKSA